MPRPRPHEVGASGDRPGAQVGGLAQDQLRRLRCVLSRLRRGLFHDRRQRPGRRAVDLSNGGVVGRWKLPGCGRHRLAVESASGRRSAGVGGGGGGALLLVRCADGGRYARRSRGRPLDHPKRGARARGRMALAGDAPPATPLERAASGSTAPTAGQRPRQVARRSESVWRCRLIVLRYSPNPRLSKPDISTPYLSLNVS